MMMEIATTHCALQNKVLTTHKVKDFDINNWRLVHHSQFLRVILANDTTLEQVYASLITCSNIFIAVERGPPFIPAFHLSGSRIALS